MALRHLRTEKMDPIPAIKKLAKDSSPQVRRECALSLRHSKSPEAPKLWAELAGRHDGKDRWYLEALGIARSEERSVGKEWRCSRDWSSDVCSSDLWRCGICGPKRWIQFPRSKNWRKIPRRRCGGNAR